MTVPNRENPRPAPWPWWRWWLISLACFVVAVAIGPLADRHAIAVAIDGSALGRNTDVRLFVSLAVMTASSVCFVVGVVRLAKWIWSKVTPN